MTNKGQAAMTGRELALDMLLEILEKGGFCHIVKRQALAKYQYLPKKERALASRLTDGVLERLLSLDYAIDQVSSAKTADMKPVIRNILRIGAYQILYMDKIPDSAACNESVKLAVKRRFGGLKGFVNGVLRGLIRERGQIPFPNASIRLSMPEWILAMWEEDYGKEAAESMGEALLRERPTCVRLAPGACAEEVILSFKGQGVDVSPVPGFDDMLYLSGYDHLEELEAFQKGAVQVQDISSSLVCRAAAPKRGSFVLDVCGAPGGKSIHMAELLDGSGMVESRDLTWQKVQLIEDNINRAGLSNIRARQWDARILDEGRKGQADIVLADLPCSGLGIIGRKPDIKYRASRKGLEDLAALQREILSVVWEYVKPGGKLIYSTCTVSRMENQENAAWFLEHFPFEPADISGCFKEPFQDPSMKQGMLQLFPGRHPCDGFFFSVFRRIL